MADGRARELRDLRHAVVGAFADADQQEAARARAVARRGQVQVDRLALLALQLLGFEDGADEAAGGRVEVFEEALVGLLVLEDGDGQGLHVGVAGAPRGGFDIHALIRLPPVSFCRAP